MLENPSPAELKKKIAQLQEQLLKYRQADRSARLVQYAINQARDIILWFNREAEIIFINDAACKSLKYSRDALLNMKISDFDPNFEQDKWSARLAELRRLKSDVFESVHRTKDGEIYPVEIVSNYMVFEGEEGCLSVVRNISERKRAEKQFKASEERYRLIADNVTDVIWTTDLNYNLTYISPSVYHQRGYTVEEAMQQPINQRLLPESVEMIHRLHTSKLRQIREGNKEGWNPTIHECEQFCKDGSIIWTQNNVKILPGHDGQPELFLGVTRDITERKLAELALQESEKKYRNMLEAMKDGVYICSPDLKIEYMNPAMIKRIGRDATGEFCHSAIYRKQDQCKFCIIDQVKEDLSVEYELENPIDKRFYSISNYPIKHSDGLISKLTISRDITENKLMKEQLLHNQKMDSIGSLAGGIAHDFNNILSGIFGYAQLAELNINDPNLALENIEQILAGANRAKDLVQQILTLSRQSKKSKEPIQIHLIVKEALKFLKSSIPATIEIQSRILSNSVVMADPTQIHQIVINLCTNGYHAMREKGGQLFITLDDITVGKPDRIQDLVINPGTYLTLSVSDTGIGMDPGILDKIFDPYFTTKEKGEGTGLGLAVVRGIVEDHGGYIQASSQPGKGSRFDVYLPVLKKTQDPSFPLKPEEEKDKYIGGLKSIMVIDDEPDLLSTTQQILEKYDYKVISYSDGLQALEAFRAAPDQIDLLITDITMPRITGDALAREFLDIRPGLPIIICSGFSEIFTPEKAAEMGIRRYLQKPIDRKTLLKTIRDVMDESPS